MDPYFSSVDFNLFEYWNILKQYINPATVIIWAIVGGIVGFLIVLILEIVFYKKILIRRRHWSLKYLSYLYMIFLPLFAGFCFTQWFGYHSCQKELVKNIPTYLGSANQLFNDHIKESVTSFIGEENMYITSNDAIDATLTFADTFINHFTEDANKENSSELSSYVFAKILETDIVKTELRKKVDEAVGETLMMDKELTQEFLDVKLLNLFDDGVLNTAIEKHISSLFGGLKSKALLMFLLGLAIPLVEIIIANRLEKKRLTPPPTPPHVTSI